MKKYKNSILLLSELIMKNKLNIEDKERIIKEVEKLEKQELLIMRLARYTQMLGYKTYTIDDQQQEVN